MTFRYTFIHAFLDLGQGHCLLPEIMHLAHQSY